MSVVKLHEDLYAVLTDKEHGEVNQMDAATVLLALAYFITRRNPIALALIKATWEKMTATEESGN